MGICVECRNRGETFYFEVDFREILHLLLVGIGASKVTLKELQSFLPSRLDKREKLVLSILLFFEVLSLPCRLVSVCKNASKAMQVDRRVKVRLPNFASAIGDKLAHVRLSESGRDIFEVDVRSFQIDVSTQMVHIHMVNSVCSVS